MDRIHSKIEEQIIREYKNKSQVSHSMSSQYSRRRDGDVAHGKYHRDQPPLPAIRRSDGAEADNLPGSSAIPLELPSGKGGITLEPLQEHAHSTADGKSSRFSRLARASFHDQVQGMALSQGVLIPGSGGPGGDAAGHPGGPGDNQNLPPGANGGAAGEGSGHAVVPPPHEDRGPLADLTEQEKSTFGAQVCGVRIHRCDPLKPGRLVRHPCVKLHWVNAKTGE